MNINIVDKFYNWLDDTKFAQNIRARHAIWHTILLQTNSIPRNLINVIGGNLSPEIRVDLINEIITRIQEIYNVSLELSSKSSKSAFSWHMFFDELFISFYEEVSDVNRERQKSSYIQNDMISDIEVHRQLRNILLIISKKLSAHTCLTSGELHNKLNGITE